MEATVDVAGGKWKPIILFHLLSGRRRFGELRKLSGGASTRSLALQLRDLEEDGIIVREVFAEVPPRVEYSLTEFGRTLAPVLKAMSDWGQTYLPRAERRLVAEEALLLAHGVVETGLQRSQH